MHKILQKTTKINVNITKQRFIGDHVNLLFTPCTCSKYQTSFVLKDATSLA